ncbi:uncharacterized protein (DUF1697 family) [Pedobacter sp. UYP30]|uniref:DUF1697 domain-containing protein n=1 Tax=Pedobacter sp. UYP30 TaxID=1756400 RepID=UPI0033910AD3
MQTYISMLRGINVSGHKIIKMEALRTLYEKLGYDKVSSYIQSGNVVFRAEEHSEKKIAESISTQIKKEFEFEVPVFVLSVQKLKKIIANNPFLKDAAKNEAFFHVTFLAGKPEQYSLELIEQKKQDDEIIAFADDAIYLYCPNGYGKTKLHNTFLEAKLKVGATTRNWKTTKKLIEMAEGNS